MTIRLGRFGLTIQRGVTREGKTVGFFISVDWGNDTPRYWVDRMYKKWFLS